MEGIRVIDLPKSKMAISICDELEEQVGNSFDEWFSKKKRDIFPRDFMWFDSNQEKLIWGYCLEHGKSEAHPYDEVEFEGGLYAVAVSIDEKDSEGERVYAGIKQWIDSQEYLALDDSEGRFILFHVISSDKIKEALGYAQLDVFVPIKIV